MRLADVQPTDSVLDLYCGLGNFSLPFAQRARELTGVEGEAGLVARAVRNAALNGITNTRFLTADLMQPDWSFFRERRDVVVLDPPRTGAEAAVAEMHRIAPRRIVYVSCHPATLARDAQVLVEQHGYGCERYECSTCSPTPIMSRRSRCSSAADVPLEVAARPTERCGAEVARARF